MAGRLGPVLVALGLLTAGCGGSAAEPPAADPAGAAAPAERPASPTEARLERLRATARVRPRSVPAWIGLAEGLQQRVRETGDAGLYGAAERAIGRALALDPESPEALTQRGVLRLARHDFRGALRDGREARRLAPESAGPYGVIVDATVELGRHEESVRALQRMVDWKPGLGAYARVAYARELRGDLDGAKEALSLAVSAGGGAPENSAFVLALLGDLEFSRGRLAAARRAYRDAARAFPTHAPAQAGLARVRAAGGDLDGAVGVMRRVVDRLPLPEHALGLSDYERAAGRKADAGRSLALAAAGYGLLGRAGVATDAEMALFEADHGDPARAVRLARTAWKAAPGLRAADALGWALTRAGRPREGLGYARRALVLGSRDARFLYHAGMSARAAGRRGEARRFLRRALAGNPRFSVVEAPRARRALRAT